MNELHRIYTPQTSQQEDLTKQAEAELFSKLAAANNIDLRQLNDGQIQQLWDATFNKTAEFPPPSDDKKEDKKEEAKKDEEKKDEEKKEAAAREHATKLAAAREEANAYHLGEVMAQGYVDHLQKLGMALNQTPAADDATKEAAMPENLAKALGKVRGAASSVASKGKEVAGKAVEAVKNNPGKAAAGAGAAGAAAGFAGGRMSKKGSALDQLAAEEAVKIAHDAGGYDLDDVADKINAVATLGLQDSTKLASTLPEQVSIRALEFLEAAGFPVAWNQPAAQ